MNIKAIDAAIAAYRDGIDPADAARLALFRELWGVQDAIAQELGEGLAWRAPSTQYLIDAVQAGAPVLSVSPVAVDPALLGKAIGRLVRCMDYQGALAPEVAAQLAGVDWDAVVRSPVLQTAGAAPGAWLEDFQGACASLGLDEAASRTATLLASLTLRPFLEKPAQRAMRAISDAGIDQRRFTTCPVCGCEPAVARVACGTAAKGRHRTLWCGQCGAVWEFERVRCARCGTRNQGHLHYHSIEGDDAHRIQSCDECGGYLRTVFEEDGLALAPFSFEIEDVLMARLDAIAADPSVAGGGARADEPSEAEDAGAVPAAGVIGCDGADGPGCDDGSGRGEGADGGSAAGSRSETADDTGCDASVAGRPAAGR